MNRKLAQRAEAGIGLDSLARRITLVLTALGALAIGGFLIRGGALQGQLTTSAEIHVAGQQRTLLQQVALLAMAIAHADLPAAGEEHRRRMREAIDRMEEAHEGLVRGSRDPSLAPPASDDLKALFFGPQREVDREVLAYVALARGFLAAAESAGDLHRPQQRYGALLEAATGKLSEDLDTVTRQYQRDSEHRLARLKRMQELSLLAILSLLLFAAFGVFRPMLLRMRREIEEKQRASESRLEAERWSGALLEAVDDGVIGFDAQGCAAWMNPAAAGLLGRSPHEARGERIEALLGNDALRRAVTQTAAGGLAPGATALQRGVVEAKCRDGRALWIEYSLSPIQCAPEVAGGVLAFRDVTRRRLDEERARKFSAAVAQAPVTVLMTDLAGRIEYVNPEFERITGYCAAEVLGRNPRIFASGKTPRERYEAMWATLLAGGTWRGEFQNRRKDGTLFWESATIAPIRDEREGRITHIIAVKDDITESKRLQARENAIRELQEAFIAETIPRELFRRALEQALALTGSRCGVLGEVVTDGSGNPALKRDTAVECDAGGYDGLIDAVLARAQAVIANDPPCGAHAGGAPAGHPGIDSFMGLPLLIHGRLVGVLGVANRPGGYHDSDVGFMEPFAASCAQVIEAVALACALKESEERLRMSQAIGHVGTWNLDIESGAATWSEEVFHIFGADPSSVQPSHERFLSFVHPDDVDAVKAAIAAAAVDFRPFDIEHRILRPNGEARVVNQTGRIYRSAGGGAARMIGNLRDVTERELANAALAQSEDFNRAVVSGALVGIVTATSDGRIVGFNPAAEEMFRCTRAHALGKDLADILAPPGSRERDRADLRRSFEAGDGPLFGQRRELTAQRSDGHAFPVELALVSHPGRKLVTAFVRDLSAQKQAEEALRRAQKLEAVGRLSGGIAHDFNNILGIVMGNLDIAQRMAASNVRLKTRLEAALNGARRGATLTRRLLGFSRRQARHTEVTAIDGLIANLKDLVARSVTARIQVVTGLATDLWAAAVDPGDLEDAILNLALNARDAMPEGGTLSIRAENQVFDERYVLLNPEASVGEFVVITVSDTGTGMPPQVLQRAFEPFFTTKDKDHGTGLGLAMVYGFAKRSGGHVTVSSQVGAGSVFRICLPRARLKTARQDDAAAVRQRELPRGSERVLLVDDEEALLDTASHQLRELGYRTLAARSGAQALQMIAGEDDIDLLFCDVVMPGSMDGYGLARQALQLRPGLKVLLTSGFTGTRELTQQTQDPLDRKLTRQLLAKPYCFDELATAVRAALGNAVDRADAAQRRGPPQ